MVDQTLLMNNPKRQALVLISNSNTLGILSSRVSLPLNNLSTSRWKVAQLMFFLEIRHKTMVSISSKMKMTKATSSTTFSNQLPRNRMWLRQIKTSTRANLMMIHHKTTNSFLEITIKSRHQSKRWRSTNLMLTTNSTTKKSSSSHRRQAQHRCFLEETMSRTLLTLESQPMETTLSLIATTRKETRCKKIKFPWTQHKHSSAVLAITLKKISIMIKMRVSPWRPLSCHNSLKQDFQEWIR